MSLGISTFVMIEEMAFAVQGIKLDRTRKQRLKLVCRIVLVVYCSALCSKIKIIDMFYIKLPIKIQVRRKT